MYDSSAYWQAQMMNWGPKILIAILILIATYIVARAVKWIIQKAIEQTHPTFVSTEELEPSHHLEPGEGKRNVGVGDVAASQWITEDQVRLRDEVLPDELERFLSRQRLGDVRKKSVDL